MTGSSKRPDDDQNRESSPVRGARTVSVVLLLIPPLLAFGAAAFPGVIPVPFVETTVVEQMRPLLAGIGVLLLALNSAFLWLIWQMGT